MNRTPEEKQELAALHALGALDGRDFLSLEQELLDDPELAGAVAEFSDVSGQLMKAILGGPEMPPPGLKARILQRTEDSETEFRSAGQMFVKENEALVIADRDGCVQWVNSNFTKLCGFSFSELRGHKPGRMLQGPLTCMKSVQSMRDAIRECRVHSQEMINYHKNGTPYRVSISLTPILDSEKQPRGFVAIERELPMAAA